MNSTPERHTPGSIPGRRGATAEGDGHGPAAESRLDDPVPGSHVPDPAAGPYAPDAGSEHLVALLGDLWARWHRHGRDLPAEVLDRPSGIGEWTVKELYAHVARGVDVLSAMLDAPCDPAEGVDYPAATDYFRNFYGWIDEASALSARSAVDYAAERDVAELTGRFGGSRLVLDRLAGQLDAILRTPFGTVAASGYLVTRIVEATVHLADLQRAVGWPLDIPDAASEVTAGLLFDLCPRQPFIDAATGRGPATFLPVLT